MKNVVWLTLILVGASFTIAYGQAPPPSKYPSMAPIAEYLMASPAVEIAAARSAAPPSISDHADVLVLGKNGYYVAAHGTNGWVCFVERAWTAGLDDPEFWNPKGRAPNCFNPPAARTVLPQYLARTKWAIAGASQEQIAEKSKAAYAGHQFTDPAQGSFSLMLSKNAYLNDQVRGPWHPHVMPFIPRASVATWAAGFDGSPIILGPYQRAYEPNAIYIIVRRWSDGTLDLPRTPVASHAH